MLVTVRLAAVGALVPLGVLVLVHVLADLTHTGRGYMIAGLLIVSGAVTAALNGEYGGSRVGTCAFALVGMSGTYLAMANYAMQ